MRTRLLLALIAVLGATAFAPAPFIKPDRNREREDGDPLARLQGTWAVVSRQRMGPNNALVKYSSGNQKMVVDGENWQLTYIAKGGGGGMPARPLYKLEVDRSTRPAHFRVKRTTTGTDYMVGIVQIEGDKAKMLYRIGTTGLNEPIPAGFDNVPVNWYLMTLEREK